MENVLEMRTVTKQEATKMNAELLDEIYRGYYKNVFNYICFRLNNHCDAEDLACLVFEKAIAAWGRYNPKFPVEGWLIGIAKNAVIDYYRARGKRQFTPLSSIFGLASRGRQPDEVVVANEENRALISAMAKLSERERQILSMKFATDLKQAEIAEVMGISVSNVGAIVHRALKKLKKLLEEAER